jgi:hypothetical protein
MKNNCKAAPRRCGWKRLKTGKDEKTQSVRDGFTEKEKWCSVIKYRRSTADYEEMEHACEFKRRR